MLEPTAVLLAHADGSPASTKFTPGSLGATDPFDRHIAYLGPDDIAAGVVQASGQFNVDDYPYSETIVVHAGRVTLQSQDHRLQLNPGDSTVIARGTSLQIEAQPDSLWAFCADTQLVEERPSRAHRAPPANPALSLGGTGARNSAKPGTAMSLAQFVCRRSDQPAHRRLGFDTLYPRGEAAPAA